MLLIKLLCLIGYIQICVTKSIENTYFEKYTYKSNFTDDELFQSTYTRKHLDLLKSETRNLFTYAWNKYMEFGFPYDEVKPLSCEPYKRDLKDPLNTVQNDALGNFSITFFDALDTWIIMGDVDKFHENVKIIEKMYLDFAIDSTIQVFETNIRLLGSLLTSHLYAIDPRRGFQIPNYNGFLLKLAYDLGKRLIVSFYHPEEDEWFDDDFRKYFTFNYPRINLQNGHRNLMSKLKQNQCTSGITSLTLEFTLLSRLSNDTIFEKISRRAVLDMWSQRSKLDLLPMSFDTSTRQNTDSTTGIGASIDSFYEYALKYAVLFNDDTFLQIWKDSYKALLTHSQNAFGIFTNVNVENGMAVTEWIDSLGAFFPGLQVLAGDLKNSIKLHRVYFKLWNNYQAIPERWNFMPFRSESHFSYLNREYRDGDVIEGLDLDSTNEVLVKNSVGLEWYPLRPEFIESTYHLYRATKDPLLLRIGEEFLEKLRSRYIAPCGFSGSLDIIRDVRQNRQESFVLSETLKYLYLLFDTENDIQIGNTIFTTEAHPFWYDNRLHSFNTLDAFELEKMNELNIDDMPNQSFLDKFIHGERFELNKDFLALRQYFTENLEKVDPLIYRIADINAFELEENGEKVRSFGKSIRVTEDEYIHLKKNELKSSVLNPDYLKLDYCQVPSRNTFGSKYFEDTEFYKLDWKYAMTLRKPMYLLDKPSLELDPIFYNNVQGNNMFCSREQHTVEWEALISIDNSFPVAPIYILQQYDILFIKDLEGLRLQFENLQTGLVDSKGEIVTNDTIAANGGRIRLTKINGLDVSDTIVMVNAGSRIFHDESIENIKSNGQNLLVNNDVVGNMRILTPTTAGPKNHD
ncbi:hypothetical protein CANINC_003237 [Pichia inconspicua]|uniref:alpha-1,2-Mannosidase n=1 Tax=Pichia inconspicua TaxID=52247 RepID=A0A4T0WZB7_9ASCO|nr:hypothetical protein CANINC_003237 [[Candida] inconspicua]